MPEITATATRAAPTTPALRGRRHGSTSAKRALVAWIVASMLVVVAGRSPAIAQTDSDWVLLSGPGPGIVHLWTSANATVFATDKSQALFRSADSGDTWQPIAAPPGAQWLLPDPTDPATLYAASADGLSKSTDVGGSWALILAGPIPSMAISPADHNVLYLAGGVNVPPPLCTVNTQLVPVCEPRIARSQDGGHSWQTATTLGSDAFGSGSCVGTWLLVAYPTEPMTLFRNLPCPSGRDMGDRLLVSRDGGGTWSEVFGNIQNSYQIPRRLVGGAGATPDRLYLATSRTLFGGAAKGPPQIYRSDDSGATWALVLEAGDARTVEFGGLAYNPDQPDEVFVAGGQTPNSDDTGVRVSEDGGATWTVLGRQDLGWINDLARLSDGTLLAATNEGILRYIPAPAPATS